MLSLELLSLGEGAGIDKACIEHRLPIPDPAKHLQTKDEFIERWLQWQGYAVTYQKMLQPG